MLTDEQKLNILAELIASPEFKDSKRFQDLLKYLVGETLAGNAIKEITLGIDFFGKGSGFDPKEDTTVRVYINNLRKKLEHYYLTCTPSIPYELIIPKGHYQVEFKELPAKILPENDSLQKNIPIKQNFSFIAILSILVFIAGFGAAYFIFNKKTDSPKYNSTIWGDFLKPDGRPTLILLGDFYFLYERASDGQLGRFIRDMRINSPEDFKQMVRNDPAFAKQYVQGDFTYLRPSSSWGLATILPIIQQSPKGFSLKLASQFTIDDAKTNNIIYIGSFKNLYSLQKILHIFRIDYNLTPAGFHLDGPDSSLFFSPGNFRGGNYEKDYAVAAKAQGPEGGIIMLLTGFSDSGVIEATHFVMDYKTTDSSFAKNDKIQNSFFTAVIETEGINQSIFKSEIKYLRSRGN